MPSNRVLSRTVVSCIGVLAVAGLAGCALRLGGQPLPRPVSDLPLIEIPASAGPQNQSDTLVIMLSGDGGWIGLDNALGRRLARDGIPVVGWSSLRYYLHRRSPTEAAYDLARMIDYYTRTWNESKVLLVGYSRGADVMPAIYNRLPEASRARVSHIVLLGLAAHITFGYGLLSWVGLGAKGQPVLPEARKLPTDKATCVEGVADPHAVCGQLALTGLNIIRLPGGHHFDHAYDRLTRIIRDTLHSDVPDNPARTDSRASAQVH